MATDKQINYVASLLTQAGYDATWMDSRHKQLGATMRQRSGSVQGWLKSKNNTEISHLIERLKDEILEEEHASS